MTRYGTTESECMADRRYAVLLEPDDGAYSVIVPAFPEIHTFGKTVDEALEMARDAIELAIAVRRDEGEEIPFVAPV